MTNQTNKPKFAPVADGAEGNNEDQTMARAPKVDPKAQTIQTFDNIPIPDHRAERPSKYPWDDRPVGGSFFIPGGKLDTFNTMTSTRNKREIEKAQKAGGDAKPKKFISRKFTHDGVEGVMIWRVE